MYNLDAAASHCGHKPPIKSTFLSLFRVRALNHQCRLTKYLQALVIIELLNDTVSAREYKEECRGQWINLVKWSKLDSYPIVVATKMCRSHKNAYKTQTNYSEISCMSGVFTARLYKDYLQNCQYYNSKWLLLLTHRWISFTFSMRAFAISFISLQIDWFVIELCVYK